MDPWGGQRPSESQGLPGCDAHALTVHLGGLMRATGAHPHGCLGICSCISPRVHEIVALCLLRLHEEQKLQSVEAPTAYGDSSVGACSD